LEKDRQTRSTMKDFFISYASTDHPWAEWIAWVLEDNGYKVIAKTWESSESKNAIREWRNAVAHQLNLQKVTANNIIAKSQYILVVLSKAYLQAVASEKERDEDLQIILSTQYRSFISIRVEAVNLDGMFAELIRVDLVDEVNLSNKSEVEAEQAILSALQKRFEADLPPLDSVPTTSEEILQVSDRGNGQLKQRRQAHTVQFFLENLTERIPETTSASSEDSSSSQQTVIRSFISSEKLEALRKAQVIKIQIRDEELELDQLSKELDQIEQASSISQTDIDVIAIEMMQIPAGTFFMGSPEGELERVGWEGPQHEVNVSTFFMGKYPITQAQWKAVAALPQINRELEPDPSEFKGDKLPIEQVSWYDAVEFCDRLSSHTGRGYRLPTEAEWEYACRAGTTTPFHFGETITTDLANYNGTDDPDGKRSGSYGQGPKGEYRKETTPIDHFAIANAFGLCDTHGNVWEWCQDHWHDNYEGAPTDGSGWLSDREDFDRVRRGGCWVAVPKNCRSAYRSHQPPSDRIHCVGFRVVGSAPSASALPVQFLTLL